MVYRQYGYCAKSNERGFFYFTFSAVSTHLALVSRKVRMGFDIDLLRAGQRGWRKSG